MRSLCVVKSKLPLVFDRAREFHQRQGLYENFSFSVNLEMVPKLKGVDPLKKGIVQPSCMFVEVRNSNYAATRHPAVNRKRQKRKLCRQGSWRNTELNRGCEVKRETLNLVVSPVIEEISAGQSSGEGRRQQRQAR